MRVHRETFVENVLHAILENIELSRKRNGDCWNEIWSCVATTFGRLLETLMVPKRNVAQLR